MKKTLKIILICILVLLLLPVVASLLAPPIAKHYVNSHGEALIGRKIALHKVRTTLPTGRVRVMDLTLYEADATTPFVHIDTIDVQVGLLRLLRHELHLKHTTVANLYVNITQEGSTFNFSDIIAHFAKDSTTTDTTPSPWRFGIYNIRFAHWKVDYADLQRHSHWQLRDINLAIPGVYFQGEQNTHAGLTLALADGGTLTTAVQYNLQSNLFDVSLDIDRFALNNIKGYLTDYLNISELQGTIGGHVDAKGSLSHLPDVDLSGHLILASVALTDAGHSPVAAFDSLSIGIAHCNPYEQKYLINHITLHGATAVMHRYATGTNFSQLLIPTPVQADTLPAPTPDTAAPRPITLTVQNLSVQEAAFTLHDHTLETPLTLPINHIQLTAQHLTLQGLQQATLTAALPHGATARAHLRSTTGNLRTQARIEAHLLGLHLQDLSPYSIHYVAYPFTSGTFSFTSQNSIAHNHIEGDNRIDIYNPEVGDKYKGADSALRIPVKTALYILKDRNGNVRLDIPVSGNLNDPKFKYWKAVWKTLGNLLVKVATSPISKVGNLLGLNSDELTFMDVDPMQETLTSEQIAKLNQLSQIIHYDSSIVVIMAQQINADAEEQILHLGEQRNQQIRDLMHQLGVSDRQFMVLTQEGLHDVPHIGYKIDSELADPQDEELAPPE